MNPLNSHFSGFFVTLFTNYARIALIYHSTQLVCFFQSGWSNFTFIRRSVSVTYDYY